MEGPEKIDSVLGAECGECLTSAKRSGAGKDAAGTARVRKSRIAK